MTDRIPRPPVKVRASLPDGNLNGLGTVAGALLGGDPPPVYALVKLVLTSIVEDVEHDSERTAVLRIAALEPLKGGRLPDDITTDEPAGAVIQRIRGNRTGEYTLPEDED